MTKQILGCIAAVFVFAACSSDTAPQSAPAADQPSASEQLAALVAEYYERNLELNPLSATQVGDDRFDDQLANWYGPEYIAAS